MICRTVALALLQLEGSTAPGMLPLPSDGSRPTAVGSVESDVYPVACHWEREEDESRCAAILTYAEDAWAVQIDGIGFYEPIPDSDGVVDIYLTDEGTEGGAYAFGPWSDAVSDDGRMGTPAYIAIDWIIPDDELHGYVAHEFNHVLQYATDFTEPTYLIWESTASAAEQWTYPETGVWAEYAVDFQAAPWMGLLGDGYYLWDAYDLWSYYEYGGLVWSLHTDAVWGDGAGSSGADLWAAAAQEGWRNEPDVLDAYDTVTGDWQAALLDLSIARVHMGTTRAPDWAPWQGKSYKVARDSVLAWEDLPLEVVPEVGPYETGTVYVEVRDVPEGSALSWRVDSESQSEWAVVVVQGDEEDAVFGAEGEAASVGDEAIVLGVVNLGAPGFDADSTIAAADLVLALDAVPLAEDPKDTGDPVEEEKAGGCACSAAGTAPAALGPWLVALLLGLRRRR